MAWSASWRQRWLRWQLFLATLSLERRWSWLSCDGGSPLHGGSASAADSSRTPGVALVRPRRGALAPAPSLVAGASESMVRKTKKFAVLRGIHTGRHAERATAVTRQQHMHHSRVKAPPEVEPLRRGAVTAFAKLVEKGDASRTMMKMSEGLR